MCKFCRGGFSEEDSEAFMTRKFSVGAFGEGFMVATIGRNGKGPNLTITLGNSEQARGVVMYHNINFCPICGRQFTKMKARGAKIATHRTRAGWHIDRSQALYDDIREKYLKGENMRQIAKELKVSYNVVRYRVQRMRERGDVPDVG